MEERFRKVGARPHLQVIDETGADFIVAFSSELRHWFVQFVSKEHWHACLPNKAATDTK